MEYKYITKKNELNDLFDAIEDCEYIALDTEFERMTTYAPMLSIIQIETGGKIFVVDCHHFDAFDLYFLLNKLADPAIEKIIHAASQDIYAIYYKYGVMMKNIFDTQLYAKSIYNCDIGYSKICKDFFRITLDKECQFSKWLDRPLSTKMLDYAANDVVYLKKMRDLCLKKIKSTATLVAKNECIAMEAQKNYDFNETNGWKRFSQEVKEYHKEYLDLIKMIYHRREKIAFEKNVTRKRIAHDEKIFYFAKALKFGEDTSNFYFSKHASVSDFIA